MELCVSLALERCANPQMVAEPRFSGNSSQDLSGRKTQPLSRGESGSKTWCVANFDTPDCCHVRPKPGRLFFVGGTLQKSPGLSWIIISIPDEKCHDLGDTHVHPNFFQTKILFPVRLSMHCSLKMFKAPILNETDID